MVPTLEKKAPSGYLVNFTKNFTCEKIVNSVKGALNLSMYCEVEDCISPGHY